MGNFEALYRQLYPSLHRYLQRLTGDPDAADDVAQEAFTRLLTQSLPDEEARLWLFTVATNLVRDRVRSSGRRKRLLEATPPELSSFPRPDEHFDRSERIAGVRRALEQLGERERQLLIMREEGFRYDEIAQAVGVAPGSVGTLIARALKRFAQEYQRSEVNESYP